MDSSRANVLAWRAEDCWRWMVGVVMENAVAGEMYSREAAVAIDILILDVDCGLWYDCGMLD